MKKTFTLLFLISCHFWAFSQSKAKSTFKFDLVDFTKKQKQAEWLYQYDQFAWITSDSVAAENIKEHTRLGEEWFCYQDNKRVWHGIYGDYKNGKFDVVFHYTGTPTKVKEVKMPVDTLILHRYARALNTAHVALNSKHKDDIVDIRLNQFIQKNADKSFTVWLLPAYQSNETLIYGGEFTYQIDSTGKILLKDDSYFKGTFTKVKLEKRNKELTVEYPELDKPTLGGIFFSWTYKEFFPSLSLKTKTSINTIVSKKVSGKETFGWQHLPNDDEPDTGKKKKK